MHAARDRLHLALDRLRLVIFPHADALALLRKTGITQHTELVFAASCLLDLALGVASCVYARSFVWWTQFALVGFYTIVISICLPAFLMEPFGPITKNITVLICLALLALSERR